MATKNIVPRANGEGGIGTAAKGWGGAFFTSTATSSSSAGAKLQLISNDGAVMADTHQLGIIEFLGAEDGSGTISVGASIEAVADETFTASENAGALVFKTTSGTTKSEVLRLDKNKLGTFADAVQINGTLTTSVDDTGSDVRFFSATAGEGLFYDSSEDELGLLLTTKLKFHDIGGGEEIFASSDGHLEINAGTTLDVTAPIIDLNASTRVDVSGALTVGGDLTVNGTTTTVNSTVTTVDDPIITLGGDTAPGSDDNKDRGVEFRYHTGSAAKVGFFGFDDSASAFTFIPDATNSSEVFSGSVGNVIFNDVTAASLDISGDADIDGTLEADAITVNGTTLAEVISDTTGAMFSSNTETGVTVTYQDADNTIDVEINAAQTTITSLLATDIKIGEDDQTKIDFETADTINFYAGNEKQLILTDGALTPGANNILDLGSSSVEFKDAFFDGTVTADAFAGPLTGNVTGNVSGTAATVTGAAQSNITSLGTLTTLTVDDITINGSTISDAGDLLFDVGGDISLDAAGGDFIFLVGGSQYGKINFLGTNNLTISGSAADHAGLSFATHAILPAEVSATTDGTIDLGASSEQFKTIFLSTGVVVADSANIGCASDTDLLTLASGLLTTTGNLQLSDGSPNIFFHTTGNHYNWMIGAQENVSTALEISVDGAVGTGSDTTASNYTPVITALANGNTTFANDIILPQDGVVAFNSVSDEYITAAADKLFFGTGNLSRVTIDGANVGIADSAFNYYANRLVVKADDEDGVTFLSSATDAKFYLAFADGTSGHAQELAGMITFDHNNNEMALGGNAGHEHLKIANGGNVTVTDGDLIIGTSGHGIDFSANSTSGGGSASAILDDYEEGTWTPTYTTSSSSSTVSYNTQTGYYTKVGNQVTCWGFLSTNTSTWNGVYVQLDGQPFASANGNMTMGIVSYAHSFGGDHPRAIYYATSTRNYLTYRDAVDGNDIELQASDMDAGNGGKNIIIFTFSYQTS